MLREEIELYTTLTGEDGWHVPIMKVGAYLDGYYKALECFENAITEIDDNVNMDIYTNEVREMIKKLQLGEVN